MPRLFILLPAYNEEHTLPPLLDSFAAMLAQTSADAWRVIVVDDGSRDGTRKVLERYEKTMPLEVVDHPQNRGLGEAIKSGLKRAMELARDEDVLVGMDADNTHPPQTVRQMLNVMNRDGADIVIASRYRKGSRQVGVPLHRQALSLGAMVVFSAFLNLPNVRDYTCGFRAYRAGLVRRAFARYGEGIITRRGFACTDELLVHLATLGPVIREVPFILRYDRKVGESKLQLGVTVMETFRMLWRHRGELREAASRKSR